ncbi:MAG TPA: site-specific integrase [Bacteroidales bacterium]|nr:site-specific integrase [Bacteroidales bacterium]
MATIKIVHFSSRKYNDGTSPIYLRLTIDRKTKYYNFPDNFKCAPGQWDKRNNQFNTKFPGYNKSNKRLVKFQKQAQDIVSELNEKNDDAGFTFDEFAEEFVKQKKELYLFEYFDQVIERLEKSGKIGNMQAYQFTKSKFYKFFKGEVEMKKVSLKDLNKFKEQCSNEALKDTSISMYLRTLRALFNRARKEESLDNDPFENFIWKELNLETEKRAISKADLLKIFNYKMEPGQPGFDSRNYWLFSYFCYGMNFSDIAHLELVNIENNDDETLLTYRRLKTKKVIKLTLSNYALDILNIYQNNNFGNKYAFPILNPEIHKTPKQIKTRIQTALKVVNCEMGDIARMLGIEKHITSYVARHSFATILKKENIGTAIISEMMGHSSESDTQIYLDSFDNSTKTEAAKKLI